MKFLPAILTFFSDQVGQRNVKQLLQFGIALLLMVLLYAAVFHVLMEYEGQRHSWLTGVYWALTVMSTLGFGDITFQSDVGRLFSIFVLLSGMIFLLILMPFTLIEFFYAPWIRANRASRAPRRAPDGITRHVILTRYDPVTQILIDRLQQYGYRYLLLVGNVEEAFEMRDLGIQAVVGDADDTATFQRLRVEHAAMVVSTDSDPVNTNVAFTVRALTDSVPIVTTAKSADSVDILELAGSTKVLRLDELVGRALGRHATGGDAQAHLLGRFGEVQVAEATIAGTPLVGLTLAQAKLRERVGVTVVGVWERGHFLVAGPDTKLSASTILLIAGTEEQLRKYNELLCIYHVATAPVVIVGGGRVGRAAGRFFEERKIDYRIIEQNPALVRDTGKYVVGSAADLGILGKAGLREAPAVLITTHDDATNIYLTIYCRRLRSDVQIIARSVLDKNVSTLHRAGADFVLSYSAMGANAIFNVLDPDGVLLIAEGLDVFRMPIPPGLRGRSLAQAGIREHTGCHVLAVSANGRMNVTPDPQLPFDPQGELVLVGTRDAQEEFLKRYGRPASMERR